VIAGLKVSTVPRVSLFLLTVLSLITYGGKTGSAGPAVMQIVMRRSEDMKNSVRSIPLLPLINFMSFLIHCFGCFMFVAVFA